MKTYPTNFQRREPKSLNIFYDFSDEIMMEYLDENYIKIHQFAGGKTPIWYIRKIIVGAYTDHVVIDNKGVRIPKLSPRKIRKCDAKQA